MPATPDSIPVVDLSTPSSASGETPKVATAIHDACRGSGFFYVVGHGVEDDLQERLEARSREFFAQSLEAKMAIRMELGGRSWRGYFPLGQELTLGKPDQKEGIYFGAELGADHPRVAAGVPLHGPNLFPDLPSFRDTVLEYLDALTQLGHRLMEAMALSLGLPVSYFDERYTRDPTVLFRIFHYPSISLSDASEALWSVGEHTDYGLLTILRQDEAGGLQIKSRDSGWIDAPPLPGAFVCNIGDMLDRMTGGYYRSTPHRVLNESGRERLSFPFFFDPGWEAEVRPIEVPGATVDEERWDGVSVHEFQGTYGEYLLAKVSHVFPGLGEDVL